MSDIDLLDIPISESDSDPILRVGYEADKQTRDFTGIGNYGRQLVSQMADSFPLNTYLLFCTHLKSHPDVESLVRKRSVAAIQLSSESTSRWRRFVAQRSTFKAQQLDLYHGLNQYLPPSIRYSRVPTLVTIYDLIHLTYPQEMKQSRYEAKSKFITSSCKSANKIVAISQRTKSDIVERMNIDPTKIEIVYPSYHPRFDSAQEPLVEILRERYKLPGQYCLYVGTICARKNLLGILKSLELIPPKERLPLVAVGEPNKDYIRDVMAYVNSHGMSKWFYPRRVRSNADLVAIYRSASLFLYLSLYEGFGMPVLEALASGTPVIASNRSAVPEAAGSGSILVDPEEPEEVASSIDRVLSDDVFRKNMIFKGLEHAALFSSERSCKAMIEIYRKLYRMDR